jgi:septum formation protein
MILAENLKGKKIILCSGSPRRKELLSGTDLKFEVDTNTLFIENQEEGLKPIKVPEFMAVGKSHGFHRELKENEILLTADTIVICPKLKERDLKTDRQIYLDYEFRENEINSGIILGKPTNREEAIKMLSMLSGIRHTVATGVCIRDNRQEISFTVLSHVWFKELPTQEIEYYVDNYKPYDKAGSYAVQEWIGFIGISRIDGSVYNVMGLPIQRVYQELARFAL